MTSKSRRVSLASVTQKPSAWVVNATDRGRKSVKSGNKIYLQDGQEFQIELHNPLTDSVLADIRINGNSVSKTGIVIRPAQRFYLDCFVEDKKKFIFKTYEVEDTKESKESISKNGTVEVYFYKEETFSINNWMSKFDKIIEKHYYPVYYPQYYPYPTYPKVTWVDYNTYNSNTIIGGFNTNNIVGGSINNSTSVNPLISSTSNAFLASLGNKSYPKYSSDSSNSIETGRIERGEESNQVFTDIDLEFEKYYISSVLYQILPESQKPVETSDIKKKFCDECGSKVLKETSKFCHECGNKI